MGSKKNDENTGIQIVESDTLLQKFVVSGEIDGKKAEGEVSLYTRQMKQPLFILIVKSPREDYCLLTSRQGEAFDKFFGEQLSLTIEFNTVGPQIVQLFKAIGAAGQGQNMPVNNG